MPVYKGVQRTVGFDMINVNGAEDTSGVAFTAISKDGGAYASSTNVCHRIGSSGSWYLLLTATEMTADLVKVRITAPGCIPQYLNLYPEADYTSTRAASIDNIGGAVSSVSGSVGSVTGAVTVGGYSTGKDPATLLLTTPANKLTTDASGKVGANNLPTDYQQRAVAVTLPSTVLGTADHTAILTDVGTSLTNQGLTVARATKIDNLDAAVSSRSTFAGGAVTSVTGAVGSVTAGVTLAAAEHTAIRTDVAAGLTTQGLTTARAVNIDYLDAAISSRSTFSGGAVASVTGSVGSVVGPVTVGGYAAGQAPDALLSAAISAVAGQVWATASENNISVGDALRLITAAVSGKSAVLGSTITFRDNADTKPRITATVDTTGQRTAISVDPA